MKQTLNQTMNTFLPILLLSLGFTVLCAFAPHPSADAISGKSIETETKNALYNAEHTSPNNNPLNDFKKSIDSNSDNETNSSSLNSHMELSMIDCPSDTMLSIGFSSCTASGELAIPTNIEGLCGGIEFSAETTGGGVLEVTGSIENEDLSVFGMNFASGTHQVLYMVSDSCDNVFECEFEITVPTFNATVVALKQNLAVALSSTADGPMATISPEQIDNGSTNPCNPIKLEIRRETDQCGIPGNSTYNADGHPNDGDSDPNSANYDPDNGQSIMACCDDTYSAIYDVDGDGVNDQGYIKVWMRVWDDTNLDGIIGNEDDTYVESWTYVKIIDILTPSIVCPADITIDCNEDYLNPDITGLAEGSTSCGSTDVEFSDIIVNLDQCNIGYIRRRWNISGLANIFCDQTITLQDVDAPVVVTFPPDFTVSTCPDEIVIEEPEWTAGPCDVIGYTVSTDTSVFEDGACIRLENQLTVINWCDYKPSDPFWDGEGIWEHTQIVKVVDMTQPTIQNCENLLIEVNDSTDLDGDGDFCEAMITLTNVAIDAGSENCPTAWLKWQVFVDLWADGTDEMEFSSFLPPFDNDFNDTNGNGIPDIYLSPTNTGEEVSIQLPDIVGPLSNHKVRWKVTDGCNNVTICGHDFAVQDQAPPIATCQDTITVGVAEMGPSRLWAINYISDAVDNCSSSDDLRYTFSETPPEDDLAYDADRRSSNYVLTLADVDNGSVVLPIYIWDENGNYIFCETVFLIDPSIVLNTEEEEGLLTDALHQNQPNPFRLNTSISFTLQQSSPVRLTIINAASSKAIEIDLLGQRGLNTYNVDRELLSGQGLYYYTMTTKNYKATKKMVLLH